MDNGVCTLNVSNSTCFNCCSTFFEDPLQDSLDAPMPWIGIYIAVASGLCFLIVVYDAHKDLGTKRFWFPSKYFSLNSFTLTILAIAMKLPVDLTSKMFGTADKLARLTSLVFMSTAMANFMTCVGSMGNNEILLNVVSLGILVITIAVNVCIRNAQMSSFDFDGKQEILVEEIVCVVVMFLLLVALCSLSIAVPPLKKQIELEYDKVRETYNEKVLMNNMELGHLSVQFLKRVVTRYWVMAQTGSPQFVIARSVICVVPGVLCLLTALLTLTRVVSLLPSVFQSDDLGSSSSYKRATIGILMVQCIFMVFSTIAPVFRWYTAVQLKSREEGNKSFKDKLVVEAYWTQMLIDWNEGPLLPMIRRVTGKKVAIEARNVISIFFWGVQVVIVVANKLVLLFSTFCAKKLLFCLCFLNESNHDVAAQDTDDFARRDIENYVVLLKDEGEISKKTLGNLCKEADKLIESGRSKQHQDLIKLLRKSSNFNGVREFDTGRMMFGLREDRVRSSLEPPSCWSLTIVTLTSIVIALPNIEADKFDLLRVISEGLYFVKLIENAMDRYARKAINLSTRNDNADRRTEVLPSIRDAADVIWEGVEQENRWQDVDIQETSRSSTSYKDALQRLCDKAKGKMEDIGAEYDEIWPLEFISAYEMYKISDAIIGADISLTDEQLFNRLVVFISDILSACLTNLAYAITLLCRLSDVEEREESIRRSALLLGESEEIIEILKKRELPRLSLDEAGYIEEWRRETRSNNRHPEPSYTANSTAIFLESLVRNA